MLPSCEKGMLSKHKNHVNNLPMQQVTMSSRRHNPLQHIRV